MMICPARRPQQWLRHSYIALVAALLLVPGAACAEPLLTRAFPPGEDACYGVQDADRNQRVAAIHVFKAQRSDPQREQPEHPRAAQMEADAGRPGASAGTRWLSLLVRFKDEPGRVHRQDLECGGERSDGFRCGVECDGGRLDVTAEGEQLLLTQDQLRLQGACGTGEGSSARLRGDAPFRLERRPMQACLAERAAARPSWAAAMPLRVRFAKRTGICHGRSYDAAHLARHPQQNVVAITLRTREKVKLEDDDGIASASFRAEIAVRTRDGAGARTDVTCHAREYTFRCASEDEQATFDLIRDGERGVLIRDVNFAHRDGSENSLAPLFRVRLGDDDRVFRLDERGDAACAFR
jgi:hypothetical protein